MRQRHWVAMCGLVLPVCLLNALRTGGQAILPAYKDQSHPIEKRVRTKLHRPGCDDGSNKTQKVVLVNLLAEHQKRSRFNSPEDFVFSRVDGTPQDPDYLRNNVFYEALKAAGIKPGYRSHGSICLDIRRVVLCTQLLAT